jgi:putative molybdopterin biosynthesis protein
VKKVFLESSSLQEAHQLLTDRLDACGMPRMCEEFVHTSSACGRITAAPVFAKYSSPAYHSAAMDGFAVRFSDTLSATENCPLALRLGEQALPVDTGDPLPDGFNAVIMLEDTNRTADFIEIYAPVAPYLNVRIAG